uniref:Guided entry of tail-anchored proteins factor 1 n=1 Tax=Caenorhabditis tropicalis TaxID=1561998 RepID=A0A1I7T5H8_9PELO
MEDTKPLQISILNVIAVICSAIFAIYSGKIVPAVASAVKSLSKPAPDPKLLAAKKKVAELKRELHGISPTGEFARYFKKDRELIKANEELAKLEAESTSETARNLKIETVVRVIMQFSNLALLRYVSYFTAYCIPDNIFWPFNFLVRFPALWGNDSCPKEFAEVSGFAMAFLMIHLLNLIWKTYRSFSSPSPTTTDKKDN